MSAWRCNTCGGEYDDAMADSTRYFHACPASRILSVVVLGVTTQQTKAFSSRRNENVAGPGAASPGQLKAEGDGRTQV